MNKVYVLCHSHPYESCENISIHRTAEGADKARLAYIDDFCSTFAYRREYKKSYLDGTSYDKIFVEEMELKE